MTERFYGTAAPIVSSARCVTRPPRIVATTLPRNASPINGEFRLFERNPAASTVTSAVWSKQTTSAGAPTASDPRPSWLYLSVGALSWPFVKTLFRLRATGVEHVPGGGLVLAANHWANLDPWPLGLPLYLSESQRLLGELRLHDVFGGYDRAATSNATPSARARWPSNGHDVQREILACGRRLS